MKKLLLGLGIVLTTLVLTACGINKQYTTTVETNSEELTIVYENGHFSNIQIVAAQWCYDNFDDCDYDYTISEIKEIKDGISFVVTIKNVDEDEGCSYDVTFTVRVTKEYIEENYYN